MSVFFKSETIVPDQPRFELFAFWRTSATYRVRVALNLKGLAARERFVNVDAGEARSEAFLRINPLGGVPALVEPGFPPLTQSAAILEYLDEIAPNPPLLPPDPRGRARVRSVAAMLATDTHPLVTPRIKRYLMDHGFDDAAWRAWQIQWFSTGLRAVEQRLASDGQTGRFCHGDAVTMADIMLMSIIVVARVFKIEVAGTPTINRIAALCEAQEAFAQADPTRQEGAPQP